MDLLDVHLALRNRARSLVVCTTGLTNLSATATGYHRAAGSFIDDRFYLGMEITPAGFSANTVDTLVGVTDTDLTTKNARAVEAVAGARSISVTLPALRSWENGNDPFTPVVGKPYLEEDFVPATTSLITMPAQNGVVEENGLYVLKWYGLRGIGVSALRKSVDALKALYAPGTSLAAGVDRVYTRQRPAPYTGQIIPVPNWAVLTLTIPWWGLSRNLIAA